MTNPAIQNDFSYYRRTISRMRINNVPVRNLHDDAVTLPQPITQCKPQPPLPHPVLVQGQTGNEVDNELANRMSLFYASATPMLKMLSDATSKFVSDVSVFFSPLLLRDSLFLETEQCVIG